MFSKLASSTLALTVSLGTVMSCQAEATGNDFAAAFSQVHQIKAGVLNVGYVDIGPKDGQPVILLHGWPYDIHSYADVAPALAAKGYRVIVPSLRGYGTTRFLSEKTPRNGQPSALAKDVVGLMDALNIRQAVFAGYDWGARTADIVAALWPERVKSALMERLRQGAGVVMLAAVALNATGLTSVLKGANGVADRLETTLLRLAKPATPAVTLQPVAEPVTRSTLPSLSGGTGWLNGDPVTSESLRGKVVLVDFWTWDCINCQHTLPHVRDWVNKYQQQRLVVIGVHTPEYPWEKPLSSVQKAIDKWQLPYRVVTDNNYRIWSAFGNQYWPAQYYFDAKGQLRYASFG